MEEEIESPHPLCVYGFGMRQFKENARAFEGWRVVKGVGFSGMNYEILNLLL